MQQEDISFRNIKDSDSDELIKLYDEVWPETTGLKKGKTEWILSSPNFCGLCAIANSRIIGSRTCFFTNIYYNERKIKGVQLADSCIHRDFRRYGIFSKMNAMFVKRFFEDGNELIYNVSVDISRSAYEKLGWKYINTMSKLTYFSNIWNVIRKTKFNYKKLAGNVSYISTNIPNANLIDNKLLEIRQKYFRHLNALYIDYDSDFLQWRLNSDSNIFIYTMDNIGIAIYKIGFRNGLKVITIGEIMLYEYSKKNLKKILTYLARKTSVDIMEIAITEAHPLYKIYKNTGFIVNPMKKYLNFGVRVESDEMKKISSSPLSWAMSTFDVDTF